MRIFEALFTLEGVLIFSTEVRPAISQGQAKGSYINPLPYIHNYPVMYGLMGKSSEAYFVIPSLHEEAYTGKKGLRYTSVSDMIRKFKKGQEGSMYVFPLIPKRIKTMSFLMSSESWTYVLPVRGRIKNVYPRLTNYTAFAPESTFFTYVITVGETTLPRWIRIGKKRWGIMRVDMKEIRDFKVQKVQNEVTSIPINIKDAEEFGYEIKSYSKLIETPNIEEGVIGWATLGQCVQIEAKGSKICLPIPEEVYKNET
ncbi:type I-D CRISPR-associated protein Csc1 [Sulfolobus sp. A20-N-G8]|nr:type I-D CRISPR-associated protein Csc1 [Sulfolobus sp. A20-N-G8]